MNERLENLMYQAGLTASGCWDEMDEYDQKAIQKFAQLIIKECLNKIENEAAQYAEPVWAFELVNDIKENFGVKE